MQTFDEAVRAAKDAKTSIVALEKAEAKALCDLAALRANFVRSEQTLLDVIVNTQLEAGKARAALQSALQRINDAPIEEQAAAQPAETVSALAIDDVCVASADAEDLEPGDYPGFEPLSEEAGRAATGFAS
jgi:hypothetical protein